MIRSFLSSLLLFTSCISQAAELEGINLQKVFCFSYDIKTLEIQNIQGNAENYRSLKENHEHFESLYPTLQMLEPNQEAFYAFIPERILAKRRLSESSLRRIEFLKRESAAHFTPEEIIRKYDLTKSSFEGKEMRRAVSREIICLNFHLATVFPTTEEIDETKQDLIADGFEEKIPLFEKQYALCSKTVKNFIQEHEEILLELTQEQNFYIFNKRKYLPFLKSALEKGIKLEERVIEIMKETQLELSDEDCEKISNSSTPGELRLECRPHAFVRSYKD